MIGVGAGLTEGDGDGVEEGSWKERSNFIFVGIFARYFAKRVNLGNLLDRKKALALCHCRHSVTSSAPASLQDLAFVLHSVSDSRQRLDQYASRPARKSIFNYALYQWEAR